MPRLGGEVQVVDPPPLGSGEAESAIYFDYFATTPTDPRVAAVVYRHLVSDFGNASSGQHSKGRDASDAVDSARQELRDLLSGSAHRVVFTSGATESINLAIKGYCESAAKAERFRIVLLPIEHSAVLDTCAALARSGRAETLFSTVDSAGRIRVDELEKLAINADLVCVMAANNEIGNTYPVTEIARICQQAGAAFLCDASQAAGKIAIDSSNIDFLAVSAHKMYGPKGVGALLIRRDRSVYPQIHGGGHQRGLRSGTLNVPGIAGFGEACRLRRLERVTDEHRINALRERLLDLLRERLPEIVQNGDPINRLAGGLNISVPGIPNNAVMANLWGKLAISTGAACSSGVDSSSHVLRALKLSQPLLDGAFRFGLGKFSTLGEVDRASELFVGAVETTRKLLKDNQKTFAA